MKFRKQVCVDVTKVGISFLAGISILAPRHLGAYTLLPPTEPFQRIFPLRDGPSGSTARRES